jgi:hypothetical protein
VPHRARRIRPTSRARGRRARRTPPGEPHKPARAGGATGIPASPPDQGPRREALGPTSTDDRIAIPRRQQPATWRRPATMLSDRSALPRLRSRAAGCVAGSQRDVPVSPGPLFGHLRGCKAGCGLTGIASAGARMDEHGRSSSWAGTACGDRGHNEPPSRRPPLPLVAPVSGFRHMSQVICLP